MVRIKRVYEASEPSDGYRVLVDRLWPRGLKKAEADAEAWLKELAPSNELRRWFGHAPSRFREFTRRYQRELENPTAEALLDLLADRAARGTVTLVYAAHDQEHNNAVVLADVIERRGRAASRRRTTSRGTTASRRTTPSARTSRSLTRPARGSPRTTTASDTPSRARATRGSHPRER
jgi:uncharacterized protein YeaO (DUF488 family)